MARDRQSKEIAGVIIPADLPKPSKGRNLPDADKIRLATIACKLYATNEFTIEDCLLAVGIQSVGTWHNWQQSIEEIKALYEKAQAERESVYFESLKKRARTALEKAVTGFRVVTRTIKRTPLEGEQIIVKGDSIPEDWEGYNMLTEVIEKETFYAPNVSAIAYVLNNQDKGNFARNPEPDHEEKEKGKFADWTEEQLADELARLEEKGRLDA